MGMVLKSPVYSARVVVLMLQYVALVDEPTCSGMGDQEFALAEDRNCVLLTLI